MLKKIVISVVVLLLAGAGGWWYITYRGAQTAKAALDSLTTAPLERGDLVETVSATGKVRPDQTTELAWQTTGIVETVTIEEGDKVTTTQVLARLKQTSLPQSVIMAQADLINAQEALNDLTTQAETSKIDALEKVIQLEADLRDAQYQLDNFTVPSDQAKLSTTQALALMKQQLDVARLAFEPYKYYPSTDDTREERLEDMNTAQANYNSAIKRLQYESEVEVAQANLAQAWVDFNKWANGPDPAEVEIARAKVAANQATLSQAGIEAPFDGTITEVNVQPGDRAAANQVAFRLDNLEVLYIDLDVSEIDIQKVQTGQEAQITFDALPQSSYHGQVAKIATVSNTTSGAVYFTVTVKITDADAAVRTGMTAEVKITVGKQQNVLLIPIQAVEAKDGQQVIYVLRSGETPQAVPISLGISSDEYSALLEGDLKEGDPLVLNPAALSGATQPNVLLGPGGPGGDEGPGGPGGPGGGGQP